MKFSSFLKDESGASAVEYALIAGLIAVVLIASIRSIGVNANKAFQNIADNLNTVK